MSQQETAHAWWSRLRHQGLLLSPVVMLERYATAPEQQGIAPASPRVRAAAPGAGGGTTRHERYLADSSAHILRSCRDEVNQGQGQCPYFPQLKALGQYHV